MRGAVAPSPVRSEVIELEELTAPDVEAWRELAANAGEPNPFGEPEFVLAAARAFAAPGVGLLVVRSGTRWLGCLPVQLVRRWRRVPWPGLATWRVSYAYLGTPLLDADRLDTALWSLVSHRQRGAGYVALEWLGCDGPIADAVAGISDRTEVVAYERFERAALVRAEHPHGTAGLSAHHRRELGRHGRRLAERLGGPLELTDRAGDGAAVERFLALEGAGWRGPRGAALNSDPRRVDLFREVCEGFTATGRLDLLELHAAGRPAAMTCNLRAGDTLFCFSIAYDEELRRYSPGVQLIVATAERFGADPALRRMDSCSQPDNATLNRLLPGRRRLGSFVFPIGGPLGQVLNRVIPVAARYTARAQAAHSHG